MDKSAKMSFSENRPLLKTKIGKTDITIEAIAVTGLIATWVFLLIIYPVLPETIPTHFGVQGKADGWGSKAGIFLLPCISTALFTCLSVLNKYPHKFNYPVKVTVENAIHLYQKGTRLIRILKAIVVLIFLLTVLLIGTSIEKAQIPRWFFPLVLLIPVFLPIAVVLLFSKNSSVNKTGNDQRSNPGMFMQDHDF